MGDLSAKPAHEEVVEALIARVRNVGQAAVPPGIPVRIYAGDPDFDGVQLGETLFTSQTLYSTGAEDLVHEMDNWPPAVVDGSVLVYAVVDDEMPEHLWQECRTDNNKSSGSGECVVPG